MTSADLGAWSGADGEDSLVPAITSEADAGLSGGLDTTDSTSDADGFAASSSQSADASTGSETSHLPGLGGSSGNSVLGPALDPPLADGTDGGTSTSSQSVVSGPGPEWTAVAETSVEADGTVSLTQLQAGQNAVTDSAGTGGSEEAGGDAGQQLTNTALQSVGSAAPQRQPAWWEGLGEPVTVRYDFRAQGEFANEITAGQIAAAESAMSAWSEATDGRLVFVRDTAADASEILNVGTGDLAALSHASARGDVLGVGGGIVYQTSATTDGADAGSSRVVVTGVAWMDSAETWDTTTGNGDPTGTVDYFTVVAHEIGHALGMADSDAAAAAQSLTAAGGTGTYVTSSGVLGRDIMFGYYDAERAADSIGAALRSGRFEHGIVLGPPDLTTLDVHAITLQEAQLQPFEVTQLLERASRATASEDAIIAITDRLGRILGVRVEQQVLNTVAQQPTQEEREELLAFMIDGAVAKARSASFFANGQADNQSLGPLTSRTVRFLSQSTITQREVESNPNEENTRFRGPGFVSPVGLGGHFPPEVPFTPPVDLFGIEHINRDSIVDPGPNNVREFTFGPGGVNDIVLLPGSDDRIRPNRLNIPDEAIAPGAEDSLISPESYGFVSGRAPTQQSRGVATLPGGIPIYRDTNFDGIGETVIGGIGVFFPGPQGFATFEQGFVQGVGQNSLQRVNAPKVLESEYIAFAAVGGSRAALIQGIPGTVIDEINGVPRIPTIDLPFGRIDLVGITLEFVGPKAGPRGPERLVQFGRLLGEGNSSGADQPVDFGPDNIPNNGDESFALAGRAAFEGYLVPPRDGIGVTAEEVAQIIEQGIQGARLVRSNVRLDNVTLEPGSRTRMVLAVADLRGNIVGLYRMKDALTDAIDAVPAKARNVSYYADPTRLQPEDQIPGIPAGTAFTGRTFRFLSEPRYPAGVEGTLPPQFSSLNAPGINRFTAENVGEPLPFEVYTDENAPAYIYDAFLPSTNFREPDNPNQNGVAWFPGSTPIYRPGTGELIGGFGVSGDGVDQNDLVTAFGAFGFLPQQNGNLRADQFFYREVRLPYLKYLRNPFG